MTLKLTPDQTPEYDEQTVKNHLYCWLGSLPRFRKWGMVIPYFNGSTLRKQAGRTFHVRIHGRWYLPGFPDTILAYRERLRFVELKRTKGGVVSVEQKAFQVDARAKGYRSDVVNAVDPFKQVLLDWLDAIDLELDSLK